MEANDFNRPVETKEVSEIATEGLKLPESYYWCNVDLEEEVQLQELYDLLVGHYVEDDDGEFRFDYSTTFLKWALTPPGYHKDWLVGIRDTKKHKLWAFISGIPVDITI